MIIVLTILAIISVLYAACAFLSIYGWLETENCNKPVSEAAFFSMIKSGLFLLLGIFLLLLALLLKLNPLW
jgi:hypothetical protein